MLDRINTFICRQLAKVTIWVAQDDIARHARKGRRGPYHWSQVKNIQECQDLLDRTAKK